MAQPAGFDFLEHAQSGEPKCLARTAAYMLTSEKHAERKENRGYGSIEAEERILVTDRVLQVALRESILKQFLRCGCQVCGPITSKTDPVDDAKLARLIAQDIQHQRLFAALTLIGGIFAVRILYKHNLNSIGEVEASMPGQESLRRKLFAPFERAWRSSQCCHERTHATPDYLICLEESFLEQLKAKRWIVTTPKFEADNLLREFGDRQNMPFIDEEQLPETQGDRAFFKFKIHSEYCDEQLRDRTLFRKQLSIKSDVVKRRASEESDILRFLKELAHPHIARVLFAFQEDQPPRLSLIFEFQPTDLQKILYPTDESSSAFIPPEQTSGRFEGSKLDDWRWEGMLGIFDAVAAIHFPHGYSKSIPIPRTAGQTLVGGHFDIKPENILVTHRGQFLLTDFGQTYFKAKREGEATDFTITTATFNYKPPPSYGDSKGKDVIDNTKTKRWTREYDVWSLACVAIEVLTLIVEGRNRAPKDFRDDRKSEDTTGFDSANFWKIEDRTEILKPCVKKRLDGYRCNADDYLKRVIDVVENMFQIPRSQPITVKACHQELSASVKRDRYMFQGRNDDLIAYEGTRKCLNDMLTSFSTDRVAPLSCSLYMWRNFKRDRISLTLEFIGSESMAMVKPDSTSRTSDAFIPLSFFDVDALFETDRFRDNIAPLQFAFQNLHDGVTFHINRRSDYYHMQGALTHQLPLPGSEQRFRSCTIESTMHRGRSTTITAIDGHLQIWKTLETESYDQRYRHRPTPSISVSHPSSEDGLPRNSSSTHRSSNADKPGSARYLLSLYLSKEVIPGSSNFSVMPGAKALAVVLLYRHTYECKFKKDPPRLIFERQARSINKKIYGAVFEGTAPMASSLSGSQSLPVPDEYPGIPLSHESFEEHVEAAGGFKKIVIEFWNDKAYEDFKEYFRKLFPR